LEGNIPNVRFAPTAEIPVRLYLVTRGAVNDRHDWLVGARFILPMPKTLDAVLG
jgi:hypothetical protein